jgi:hypothetical protein
MSRLADEKNERKPQTKGNGSGAGKGRLVNYSPTEGHRKLLKEGFMPLETSIAVLEKLVTDGHRISVGASLDKGGYFVIMREGVSDWNMAQSVSAWAGTLEKAIRLAAFYLSEVNPDFPQLDHQLSFRDDW